MVNIELKQYIKLAKALAKENKQLKQQLAEKEKTEKQFKTLYFNKCLDYEHLHEKLEDKYAEFELKEYDYKQTIFEKDQDKISFAVEQLEKVKEYITSGLAFDVDVQIWFEEYIDNQIKRLKEKQNEE